MTEPKLTPPPEPVEQWMQDHATKYDLARHAAQWDADAIRQDVLDIATELEQL